MKDAENTPNVVKACNKPRLFDELEDLQKRYIYVDSQCPPKAAITMVGVVVSLYHASVCL